MDLRIISKDFFNKTQKEKNEICETVLRDFIEEMFANRGNLIELESIITNMKEVSIEREEFEITEILSTILEALKEFNY